MPQFFTKATGAVNSPNGDVRLDARLTSLFDYEVELAVVIGRGGRDIPKANALEHVFGYTVANDFTARDLQRATSNGSRASRSMAAVRSGHASSIAPRSAMPARSNCR